MATDIATYECSIYRVKNEHDIVIEPRFRIIVRKLRSSHYIWYTQTAQERKVIIKLYISSYRDLTFVT